MILGDEWQEHLDTCTVSVQVIEYWGDDSTEFSFRWLKINFTYVLLSALNR